MSAKKNSAEKVNNLSLSKEAIAQLSDADLQNVTGGQAAGDVCVFKSSSCTITQPPVTE
jgi:bacteriocin-like protein